MLLALRSLYETETPPAPVIIPAGRRRKKPYHYLGVPVIPSPGLATVTGTEIKFSAGRIRAIGRAITKISVAEFSLKPGQMTARGNARTRLTGNAFKIKSGTMKAKGISDDEEAIFLSLLATQ